MEEVIKFDELLVKKNELMTDSPYTDYHVIMGNNEDKEELGTMVDKLDEIYEDIGKEFKPSFTHLVMRYGRDSKRRILLWVGSGGYVWIPQEGLRLETNERLTESLTDILKGYALECNKWNMINAQRAGENTYTFYDITTLKPMVYRDCDGLLCVDWNAESELCNIETV